VPFVKRANYLPDSISGGAIAVLAVLAACLVAAMLTAFAAAAAGIGVVLLLSFWMGTKSPALPALGVVAAVLILVTVAWLGRAPLRRAIERTLVWMMAVRPARRSVRTRRR
jgi:hypothetical protein